MEKRIFIAIILSFGVLYVYSLLVPQPPRNPAVNQAQQQATSAKTAVSGGAAAAVQAAPATTAPGAVAAKDITIETDLYTAVFTTRGAALKKFVLKNYKDVAGPKGQPIVLLSEDAVQPATLRSDAKAFGIGQDAIYAVNGESGVVSGGGSRTLEFSTASGGFTMVKRYTVHSDRYAIDLDQQIINRSAVKTDGAIQLLLTNHAEAKQGDNRFETYGPVTFAESKLHADAIKDLAKGAKDYSKEILWTGFNDKYFLNSVLSVKDSIATVKVLKNQSVIENVVVSPPVSVGPGQAVTISDRVYIGPKDLDILKAQGNRLEEVIDFGWFSAIAKPLLQTINFFHRYTGNYGIAIIIITIILKVLFFPLTHKSYKSMKDMQKLQPKMAALKEKHKNDRDALNKAIMELYQTHKVNPVGGCLPMIVQIPVFFALYKALMFSIELRHAPFMLWIHDLAAKDPYYVTPIVMGVTMFVQQKMTPNTGMDPAQAKMMLALPVVFTFMFLNFPSGLVLYWLVNNILTIAQQYYINKSIS